jgi:hypothetical protein
VSAPDSIEPVDPELAPLLDAERKASPPPGALDRIWARVAGAPTPSGGGGASGGAARNAIGRLASHVGAICAAAFVAGAVAGVGAYSMVRPPAAERIVYVEREVPARIEPPAPASSFAATPVQTPTAAPGTTSGARPVSPPAPSSLAAERTLLDDARAALASGDAGRALQLGDEHLRRFPRGQLGEEREAIAIQSLVALGRYPEARARAAHFRAAAPQSLFMPAIDAALSSIP